MADHLTTAGNIAAFQRRQSIVAIREDAIVIARHCLAEGYPDSALATLVAAADRIARLEDQS